MIVWLNIDWFWFWFIGICAENHNSSSTSSPGGGGAGGGMRPPTLNIFPSQPMHVEPSTKVNNSNWNESYLDVV